MDILGRNLDDIQSGTGYSLARQYLLPLSFPVFTIKASVHILSLEVIVSLDPGYQHALPSPIMRI